MQSFRTELENPVIEKDIIQLEKKIYEFKNGNLHEESFRSLRLARGVYGQRQQGVQMVRIKLPLGIISPAQLRRISLIATEYSNGILHLTTRQDVQVHYVSLDRTPELWADLEKDDITLREACGNTVRNITASPFAGIDQEEPFDITPYGWALFNFFLRNPIGQELGRKFKVAISSSSKDFARAYMHDLGLIPVVQEGVAGFKILIAGGLGAQPALASQITSFLPAEDLLKFGEAIVKVFDKYGERNKRQKARLKFLVKEIGLENLQSKLADELIHTVAPKLTIQPVFNLKAAVSKPKLDRSTDYGKWFATNVFAQKQSGHFAVLVKVLSGNLTADQTQKLADIVEYYSGEPARLTIDQNLLIRSVAEDLLNDLYNDLAEINLADYGAGTVRDITACPGTQTCNLGITATYNVAEVIEKVLVSEFNELIFEEELIIKISGCMNACGQHSVADIGFHGSSFQSNGSTVPALQVLLGGANLGDGNAQYADKVIKVPTKRVENVIRFLLNDFKKEKSAFESFNTYYNRKGKIYFYDLLKPLADVSVVQDDELIDWGSDEKFKTEIGVGECAGVKIDLVKTLLFEANEKLEEAEYFFLTQKYPDAAYTVYSSIIQTAKSYLLKQGIETNSKGQIIESFEPHFEKVAAYLVEDSFQELVDGYIPAQTNLEILTDYLATGKRFHQIINS
jgi:sulfite reductase (ferredoxin)